QPARIDTHAAGRSSERDTHERRLPRVEHGEGTDLVEVEVWHVADPAARRSAVDVVMNAVAGVDLDVPVVVRDGEADRQLALRHAQYPVHPFVEVEPLGREVELPLGVGPDPV